MPRLAFAHIDDAVAQEVRPQLHPGNRKAAVHIKTLEHTEDRMVLYTRYDPGLVLRRHSHRGDAILFILEGDLMVGDVHCRPGTSIVLEKGAAFGPLIAGEQGTVFLEIYIGPNGGESIGADDAEYRRILEERGITLLPEPAFARVRTDA